MLRALLLDATPLRATPRYFICFFRHDTLIAYAARLPLRRLLMLDCYALNAARHAAADAAAAAMIRQRRYDIATPYAAVDVAAAMPCRAPHSRDAIRRCR